MSDTLQLIQDTEVTHTLDLGDYDEAYRGATFDVWITPPRSHWRAWNAYITWLQENIIDQGIEEGQIETLNAEMYRQLDAWMAETWRNLSLDETTQIRERLENVNPGAWQWLYNETLRVMREYRERRSKN